MKPNTADDVLDIMDSYIASSALNAAMELGLFWLLKDRVLDTATISEKLNIPGTRCQYWLQLLIDMELIATVPGGFAPTATAQSAILATYSPATWSSLASMARERFPAVFDLANLIRNPASTWEAQGLAPPNYFEELQASTEKANEFTRMLYEIHLSLAAALADHLDIKGANRVLDLGGGSGVFSLALLRKHKSLEAVVVDIENVCTVGRAIAAENRLENRIKYVAADFEQDELPKGFDMVMACDTGPYSEALFRKVREALNPGGRFIIVEQLPAEKDTVMPPWLTWSFRSSLHNSDFCLPSIADIQEPLEAAGFHLHAVTTVPHTDNVRWSKFWFVLEAHIAE